MVARWAVGRPWSGASHAKNSSSSEVFVNHEAVVAVGSPTSGFSRRYLTNMICLEINQVVVVRAPCVGRAAASIALNLEVVLEFFILAVKVKLLLRKRASCVEC